jgi:hypothetical protein
MKGKWLAFGALAGATLAVAAGIAYAEIPDANKVFTGCMQKNSGTLRLIDPSFGEGSALGHCSNAETQVTWNQEGQAGKSPTVAQLATGDPNCPAGGAAITDAAGTTAYVCSGEDGQDGADFDGSFTSPNGQFKLNVDDSAVKLEAPGGKLTLGIADAKLEGAGILTVRGPLVQINSGGGCQPAARVSDQVATPIGASAMGFPGGVFFGTIMPPGAPTVCIG